MITTATQIFSNSNLPKNFEGVVCRNLDKWEKAAFRDCLGVDFYKILVSDLKKYSPIDWDEDLELIESEFYLYEGEIYQYVKTEDAEGVDTPNCSSNWTVPDKFTDICYQLLWENGLVEYLATYIHYRAMPFGKDLLYEEFDLKRYNQDREDIKCEALECLEEVKCWIQEQCDEGECDFEEVEFIKNTCADCVDNIQSTERVAFLN